MDSPHLKRTKRLPSAPPIELSAPPRQSAPPQKRFAAPVTLEKLEDLKQVSTYVLSVIAHILGQYSMWVYSFRKVLYPRTPQKNNQWALNNFQSWLQQYNKQQPEDPCPADVLLTKEPDLLSKWLSLFVLETRKLDGSEYPPSDSMLHSEIHEGQCRRTFNIFNKADHRFRCFRGTCDSEFQRLYQNGVGVDVKHAEIITAEEEEMLWSTGVLGVSSPKALLRAIFLNGKNFCLRGGQEHRELKISQFVRGVDHWKYVENGSKNHKGGLKNLRHENKVVRQYACPELGERCHVSLLDTYFAHIPPTAFERDNFYLRPLAATPVDPSKAWFTSQPIGWNSLQSMVKDMCAEAGVNGNKTNYSLRAAGATQLFSARVPEKVIQQRTGHKSLDALRRYENTSKHQYRSVSAILSHSQRSWQPHTTPWTAPARPTLTAGPVPRPSSFQFQNLQGCVININTTSQPGLEVPPAQSFELTADEVKQFLDDLP